MTVSVSVRIERLNRSFVKTEIEIITKKLQFRNIMYLESQCGDNYDGFKKRIIVDVIIKHISPKKKMCDD